VSRRNKRIWARRLHGAALFSAFLCAGAASTIAAQAEAKDQGAVLIPGGSYVPIFSRQKSKPTVQLRPQEVRVGAFLLDRFAVTNAQYRDFLNAHPEWRKSQVKALFADENYLNRWNGDLSWSAKQLPDEPVTSVSWFAAKAYCEDKGGALPTTDQWEYALWDQGRHQDEVKSKSLAWFAVPNTSGIAPVTSTTANGYGIHGLVGLIWEWTLDLESAQQGSDTRNGTNSEKGLYCGAASLGAKDPSDYAAFMRYSFRSCLKASFTTKDLGFRCAYSVQ
jgi:formylglycine-generating enzyme required for sulfatase activity